MFAAGNDPEIIERDRMGTQKRKQRLALLSTYTGQSLELNPLGQSWQQASAQSPAAGLACNYDSLFLPRVLEPGKDWRRTVSNPRGSNCVELIRRESNSGGSVVKNLPANAGDTGDLCSIP